MNNNHDPKASRRTILQAGLVIAAGAASVRHAVAAAEAPTKVEQSLVAYQDKPAANGQKCSTCQVFLPPNACATVAGTISPNGWCGAFIPKT